MGVFKNRSIDVPAESPSPIFNPLDSCRHAAEWCRREIEGLKKQREEYVSKTDKAGWSIAAEQKKLAEWERAISVLEREFPVEYVEPVGPTPSPYLKAKEEMLEAALRNQLAPPPYAVSVARKELAFISDYDAAKEALSQGSQRDFVISFKCGCCVRFLGGEKENRTLKKCTMENGCYFDEKIVGFCWENRNMHTPDGKITAENGFGKWENAKP